MKKLLQLNRYNKCKAKVPFNLKDIHILTKLVVIATA